MKCNYPNCRQDALWVPVIALPTVRIPADIQHERPDGVIVTERQDPIKTTEPTYLLGKEVCMAHKLTYKVMDWISKSDWKALQEAAHENGFHIPTGELIQVSWQELDWTPGQTHLELERTH